MSTSPRIPIGEASRLVHVSLDTLRRWAASGRVRCWRGPGGRRYFDPRDLRALLKPQAGRSS